MSSDDHVPAKETRRLLRTELAPKCLRALEMFIWGKTYDAIAKELGCCPTTAWNYVQKGAARAKEEQRAMAPFVANLMFLRMESMVASAGVIAKGQVPQAVEDALSKIRAAAKLFGDTGAVETVTEACDEIMELALHLDNPEVRIKAMEAIKKFSDREAKLVGADEPDRLRIEIGDADTVAQEIGTLALKYIAEERHAEYLDGLLAFMNDKYGPSPREVLSGVDPRKKGKGR